MNSRSKSYTVMWLVTVTCLSLCALAVSADETPGPGPDAVAGDNHETATTDSSYHDALLNVFWKTLEVLAPVVNGASGLFRNIHGTINPTTEEKEITDLIDMITRGTVANLPVYIPIDPVEMKLDKSYFCGARGLMGNLKKINRVKTEINKVADDKFRIEVNYTIRNLMFNYTKSYSHIFDTLGITTQTRYLVVRFENNNNVRVKLELRSFSQMAKNQQEGKCIFYVSDVELTQLKVQSSFFSGVSWWEKSNVKNRNFENTELPERKMREIFNRQMVLEIYNLERSNVWVCATSNLIDTILRRGIGSKPALSTEFPKRCGDDLYIKPYQFPKKK